MTVDNTASAPPIVGSPHKIAERQAPTWDFRSHPGKPLHEVERPFYVDDDRTAFKHHEDDMKLQFSTDWNKVNQSSHEQSDVCMVYYPPSLDLSFDLDLEDRLFRDLQEWSWFQCIPEYAIKQGLITARYCSLKADIRYEQRAIIHHYLVWIFVMDAVSEQLPLHGLHSTAGKVYLENLKSIMRDGPIEDMKRLFHGSCPDEVLDTAVLAQRLLAEDILPLMRSILTPHHVQMCVETLDLFLDNQYYEGQQYHSQPTSDVVMQTRAYTIGTMICALFYLPSSEAQLWNPNDPLVIHMAISVAHFNDFMGMYKDRASLEKGGDASAGMNMVLLSMKEHQLSEHEALRHCAQKINVFLRQFEQLSTSLMPDRQRFYHHVLRGHFALYDFHLLGLKGKCNGRYGWRVHEM
ncbi:hypothetical protein BO70DRAFT_377618 [Aspergillus heteromorphus CBS 117.55]|uniref:Terpenoid synthase n=1 Tax=Aspergillus heteromorphus CBS 117.55 TaxID=1448321 RepID=A0A317WRY1_9EURO|nr:uncharacterized protein BO70DRAFT_377618 [Aspergillus heteromorphus CBS 117.55]PWY89214.1 hypothetical protein BO70DRAFT_377618 [Aspergillus heteromorphus CBS 117.55]